MKTNTLKHKIGYTSKDGKMKMVISIRLDDECKNGHPHFTITCMAHEFYNGRWQESFGGCAHDEILKAHPELKIFVDLHLSDQNGAPMYAEANGFYHAFNQDETIEKREKITCNYMRITKKEFKQLTKIKDKLYFKYLIEKLNLAERWKRQANKAIIKLESLTKQKWDNKYKWDRSNYKKLTTKEIKDIEKLIKKGYYTSYAMRKREIERNSAEIEKKRNNIIADYNSTVNKARKEKITKLFVFDRIQKLMKKYNDFLISHKNIIYYSHSNELSFNWVSYEVQCSKENFQRLCDSITEKDFALLPKDISFTLKENDKKIMCFNN